MQEHRITIYRHPNQDIRSFLLPVDVSAPRVEHFEFPLGEQEEDARMKALGAIGAAVVKDMMQLPGIRKVSIKPREIRVQKDPQASWEEMQLQLLQILRRALRRKRIRLVR